MYKCLNCKRSFKKRRVDHVYCSPACRSQHHKETKRSCEGCGTHYQTVQSAALREQGGLRLCGECRNSGVVEGSPTKEDALARLHEFYFGEAQKMLTSHKALESANHHGDGSLEQLQRYSRKAYFAASQYVKERDENGEKTSDG